MIQKVLIANRGEIALRIVRACREMGIKSVIVYSEADREAKYVKLAEEAVCIGQAPYGQSYLSMPAIISAAEVTDAEAIHPGYGFLAEDAHFAEICDSCKIKFIGPTPDNIRRMGDKMAAKDSAKKAGVPTIPGSKAIIKTKEEALKIAKEMRYPVIIKAAAGGGGKGMRVVAQSAEFLAALASCKRESLASFGDDRVLVEKYVLRPRHIEIQVFGDTHGHCVHLFERDWSVQRRHQKVLEEAPAPGMTRERRAAMGEAAVAAARHGVLAPGTSFIEKPFSPAQLLERVRAILDEQRPARDDAGEG